MPPLIDLTGKKFVRLRVIGRAGTDKFGKPLWAVVCKCGGETKPVSGALLRSGKTTSCGCVQREDAAKKLRKFRRSTPDTTVFMSRDSKSICRQCGLPLVGHHAQRYHPECWKASRTKKRYEQRVGKPEHQAATIAAELEKRNEVARET